MNAAKEILISTVVGLTIIFTFLPLRQGLRQKTRIDLPNDPIAVVDTDVSEPSIKRTPTSEERPVVVAVIDTGCDIHHPDLQNIIWTNPGESGVDEYGQDKASNGVDDDDNGYVDDVHGWDFVSNSPALMDEHGHGTHVAGIIGAMDGTTDPHVSLMILKYYDTSGDSDNNLERSIAAMRYAVQMGAQIINYSGGGLMRNTNEQDILTEANARGILVVAAAGNEGQNSDFFPFYPADYDLPNILSVAATDEDGHLLKVSNYGRATVDLAAPGRNILSTLPRSSYGYMTGTSQAAAFVTRKAASVAQSPIGRLSMQDWISNIGKLGQSMASLAGHTAQAILIN